MNKFEKGVWNLDELIAIAEEDEFIEKYKNLMVDLNGDTINPGDLVTCFREPDKNKIIKYYGNGIYIKEDQSILRVSTMIEANNMRQKVIKQ